MEAQLDFQSKHISHNVSDSTRKLYTYFRKPAESCPESILNCAGLLQRSAVIAGLFLFPCSKQWKSDVADTISGFHGTIIMAKIIHNNDIITISIEVVAIVAY